MSNYTGAKMELRGDKELRKLFEELPKRVLRKGLRQAISAAASPIVKDAKRNARRVSGLLKKAINKKIKTFKNGNVIAIIGASRSVAGSYLGRKRVPAHYIHLVEKGTRPHALGKGSQLARVGKRASREVGQHVGRKHPGAKAHPFLEPAWRRNINTSIGIASQKLKAVVEAEALKLGKRR